MQVGLFFTTAVLRTSFVMVLTDNDAQQMRRLFGHVQLALMWKELSGGGQIRSTPQILRCCQRLQVVTYAYCGCLYRQRPAGGSES